MTFALFGALIVAVLVLVMVSEPANAAATDGGVRLDSHADGSAIDLTGQRNGGAGGTAHEGSSDRDNGGAGGGVGGAGGAQASTGDECYMILFIEAFDRTWVSSCDLESIAGTENTPWWERTEPEEPGEAEEGDPAPPGQPVIVTVQEVQSLLVDAGGITVQPERPWVLVNMETIAMTGASEQLLSTVVLGVPVQVRVIPAEFSWDFGDGAAPIVGTDPGAAWPNHTVSHVFTRPGTVSISVTTQWDAYFQPEGGAQWIPVAGRAVTTESSGPIEVVTAIPRLTTGS